MHAVNRLLSLRFHAEIQYQFNVKYPDLKLDVRVQNVCNVQ